MKKLSAVLAGTVMTLAAAIAPAWSAPAGTTGTGGATVTFVPEDYDAWEHFDAGEGFCVPWAGSFHEVRHGGYRIVAPPGGQLPGEIHVNGVVDGLVELVPDDTRNPTYAGTYREKVNGVVVSVSSEEDVERVGQYRLASTLHGSDGSTLHLRLAGKVTVNGRGRVVLSHDELTCT
jgi:hypothetical protein